MMVGKALYEGILLNLTFAPFFIRCLQVSTEAARLQFGVSLQQLSPYKLVPP